MLTSKMSSVPLSSADSKVPIEMLETTIPWFLKTSSLSSSSNDNLSQNFYNDNNIKTMEKRMLDNETNNADTNNDSNDELTSDKSNDISPTTIEDKSIIPNLPTNATTSMASGCGDLMGGMRGGLLAKQHLNNVLEVYFKNEDYISINENANTDTNENSENKIKFTNLTREKYINNVKTINNEQMSDINDNNSNGLYLSTASGLVSLNTVIPSSIKKQPSTLSKKASKLVLQKENHLDISSTLHCNRNTLITHNKNHIDFSAYRISSSSASSLIKENCTDEKKTQKLKNNNNNNENLNIKSTLCSSNTQVSKEHPSEPICVSIENVDKIQNKNCSNQQKNCSNDLLGQLNNYKISRNFNDINLTKDTFYEPLYSDIPALDSDFYIEKPCIKTQNNMAVVMNHSNDDHNEKLCKEPLKRTCSSSYDSAYLSINSNESNNKIKNQKLSDYVIKKDTSDKYMIHKSIFEGKDYRENPCNIKEVINGNDFHSSKINIVSNNCMDHEYSILNNEMSENVYMEPVSSSFGTTTHENFNSKSINCYTTTFPTLEKQNNKARYVDDDNNDYYAYLVHNNSNFRRTKSDFNVNGKKSSNIEYRNQIKYIKNLKLSSLNSNTFIDMNNRFRQHTKHKRPSSDYFHTNWLTHGNNVPDVIMTHDLYFKPSGRTNKIENFSEINHNLPIHCLKRPASHYSGETNINYERTLPNPLNQWDNFIKKKGFCKMGFSNLSLDKNKFNRDENYTDYSSVIVNNRYNSFNVSKNRNRNINELCIPQTSLLNDNNKIITNNGNTLKNDENVNIVKQIDDSKIIGISNNGNNDAGITYRRNSMKVTKNRWSSFKKTFSVILEKNNKNENLFDKKLESDMSIKMVEQCNSKNNNNNNENEMTDVGLIVKNTNFDEKNVDNITNEKMFYGRCNSIDFLDDCPNNQWKESRSKSNWEIRTKPEDITTEVEVPKRRKSVINRKMSWLRKTFKQKKKPTENTNYKSVKESCSLNNIPASKKICNSLDERNLNECNIQSGFSSHSSSHKVKKNGSVLYKLRSMEIVKIDSALEARDWKSVTEELLKTERDYVESLNYVTHSYIPMLEISTQNTQQTMHSSLYEDHVPAALRGKTFTIFGNIKKLTEFHTNIFQRKLELCRFKPLSVGRIFLEHENDLRMYSVYSRNKPKSDRLMNECGRQFFKKKQQQLEDNLGLESQLLKPIQRLSKYAQLLHKSLTTCPLNQPEYEEIEAALEMVRFELKHGEDLLAADCIVGSDVNLQEQGMLLRRGELMINKGFKKFSAHVFLYEDILLFTKTKKSKKTQEFYVYKFSYKTSDIGLTETIGDDGKKFEIWFRKRTPSTTLKIQAKNEDVKNKWTKDFSSLLWRQSMKLSKYFEKDDANNPSLPMKAFPQGKLVQRPISFSSFMSFSKTKKEKNTSITNIAIPESKEIPKPSLQQSLIIANKISLAREHSYNSNDHSYYTSSKSSDSSSSSASLFPRTNPIFSPSFKLS